MHQSNTSEKILIIDDEQSTLNMLRLLLRAIGYTVLTAENGKIGLEAFRRDKPSIVITDIRMPGLDGVEVLTQIKQTDPNVEVIVVTGHGDMDLAIRCLQLDASDFITKPVQRDILEVALRRARERTALRQQVQEYTSNLETRVAQATAELEKSCDKLKMLCEMSQSVAGTQSLAEMADILRNQIHSMTSLTCHSLLLLNSRHDAILSDPRHTVVTAYDGLERIIRELEHPRPLGEEEIRRLCPALLEERDKSWHLLPIVRQNELPAGAALVGVPEEAADDDFWLAWFVFRHVAGAIRRAVLQEEEIRALKRMAGSRGDSGTLVGRHDTMEKIYKIVAGIADSEATVLIQGESGTGKELIARRIHELSSRSKGPFIALNCAAFPQSLLESELFGYEKGAFTGAVHSRKGSFEQADGGTIFLDEVGEITLSTQVKLLRVLQFREFQRLGSETSLKVNVRVLAATSRNLRQEIERGAFRDDLYYRLHVIPITMPPLRDRMSDLPLLIDHFIRKFSESSAKRVSGLDPKAMQILKGYHWPGNVRELENVIEHGFVLTRRETIGLPDLPAYLLELVEQKTGAGDGLDDLEKHHLIRVLKECHGNKIQAARRLKISRSTLYRKLEHHGLVDIEAP